jgi:exodeoxyribonuclease VII small subunit
LEAKIEVKLEDAFVNLEDIIKKLETSSISLEESFQLYKEGMNLLELCNKQIDQVEKDVLKLNERGELHEF